MWLFSSKTSNLCMSIIFKNCLQSGSFPENWKKSNVQCCAPIHKKGDKQLLLNYQAVSPLPICGKIFELFSTLSSNISKSLLSKSIWFLSIWLVRKILSIKILLSIVHDILTFMLILITIQLLKWELIFDFLDISKSLPKSVAVAWGITIQTSASWNFGKSSS